MLNTVPRTILSKKALTNILMGMPIICFTCKKYRHSITMQKVVVKREVQNPRREKVEGLSLFQIRYPVEYHPSYYYFEIS